MEGEECLRWIRCGMRSPLLLEDDPVWRNVHGDLCCVQWLPRGRPSFTCTAMNK